MLCNFINGALIAANIAILHSLSRALSSSDICDAWSRERPSGSWLPGLNPIEGNNILNSERVRTCAWESNPERFEFPGPPISIVCIFGRFENASVSKAISSPSSSKYSRS
ncbi:hypothetical protein AA313_de0200235 [Arthrobotrys entomopaga]|nr:hypothetical protein AA313_de0200235 [Arthrobotrys entomopaga]